MSSRALWVFIILITHILSGCPSSEDDLINDLGGGPVSSVTESSDLGVSMSGSDSGGGDGDAGATDMMIGGESGSGAPVGATEMLDYELPIERDEDLDPPFDPDEGPVDEMDGGVSEQTKSFKRGIASAFSVADDLSALMSGVSWWYNWSPNYNGAVSEFHTQGDVSFIPMTWNGNNPDQIRAFLDGHPETQYLLTYNEPNFQDQANMTPEYAASIWPIFEGIAEEYGVELVGPALNYCGGCVVVDGSPIASPFWVWMDLFLVEFQAQHGREPRMDYTALHWYDYGLEDQIDEMVTRYGKPVWLTEFALWRWEDWCTPELEREWLLEMVAYLEAHPMVYRYAWFTGRRPDFPKINLLGAPGQLTELGEAYINAPF